MSDPRWKATVTYRSDRGLIPIIHYLEELEEIHELVEAGPHWDTVADITIVRHDPSIPGLTIEKADVL